MDGGSVECCMSMLVAEKFLFTAGIKASTIARVACAGAGKGEHGSHALFKCGSLQFGWGSQISDQKKGCWVILVRGKG